MGLGTTGVAIDISFLLQSYDFGLTPVNEHMMQIRLKQTLLFIYLNAIYSLSEMYNLKKKEMFYERLD